MDDLFMRILNVLPSISPETGGSLSAVLQLCKKQGKQGNEVFLYTTPWPNKEMGLYRTALENATFEISIRLFPWKCSRLMSQLPYSPDLVRTLAVESAKFDLIIVHSLWNPLATFSMRTLRKAGSSYCLMPHGMLDPIVFKHNRWKKLPWAFLWEKSNVEAASTVLFNSIAEEQKAKRRGWHFHRTFVLPHFLDFAFWKNLPPRSDFEDTFPQVRGAEVILYVGRINWVKNLDKLIDAIAKVRLTRGSAMLVCVGPDSNGCRAKLEQKIRDLGLNEHVLFTGMLEGDRLKAAYARGDVLALVSQKENFGLTAAEGLASGLPVVVSEGVDIAKDWPSEGPIRRVVPTPEDISRALVELLERSSTYGVPDPDARALAEKEFAGMGVSGLPDLWESLTN
jgi:glycosyltransferase involved in cell wall biosynthesis